MSLLWARLGHQHGSASVSESHGWRDPPRPLGPCKGVQGQGAGHRARGLRVNSHSCHPLTRRPALGLVGIFQSTFRWPLRLAPSLGGGQRFRGSDPETTLTPRQGSPQPPGCPGSPPLPRTNPARAGSCQPGLEAVWAAGLNGDEVKVRGLRSCNCPSWEPEMGQGPACQLETPSQSVTALGTHARCSAARAAPIPARGCLDAGAGRSPELSCAFPPTLPRSGSSPSVAPSVKDRNCEGARSLGSWPGLLAGTGLRPAGSGGNQA